MDLSILPRPSEALTNLWDEDLTRAEAPPFQVDQLRLALPRHRSLCSEKEASAGMPLRGPPMGWSGRAPALPAIEVGKGRQRQGAQSWPRSSQPRSS